MTPEELMAEVMRTYPAADYKLNVPKMPIGQLIIQYEETDWEFLNRFLPVIRNRSTQIRSLNVSVFWLANPPIRNSWNGTACPIRFCRIMEN